MPPYAFARLPATGWLRLLTFRADGLSPLKCSIGSFKFECAPEYYTLSYHWGTNPNRVSLDCDGGQISISQPLYRALLRLRALSKEDGVSHFWVDQICINQADTDERTSQVLLMHQIYSQSQRTLIWLALLEHQNSQDIFRLLNQVDEARKVSESLAPQSQTNRILIAENEELKLPEFASPLWTGLGEFISNPWFQRAWIVQEAALSRISPLILCEDQSIDFDRFFRIITWLDNRGYDGPTGCVTIPATSVLIYLIRRRSDPVSGLRFPWRLEGIIRMANYLRTTDPRDRIYALLGLTAHGQHGQDAEEALLPDYRRDIVELYSSVTRYCIKDSKRLYILGSGGVSADTAEGIVTETSSFPSWVPRWDCPRDLDIILSGPHKLESRLDETSQVDVVDRMPYNASLSLAPLVAESDDSRELILGGFHLDTISWSSDIQQSTMFESFAQSPLRELWEHSLRDVGLAVDPEDQDFQTFATSFYMALGSGLDLRDMSKFGDPKSIKHFWSFLTACCDADGPEAGGHDQYLDIYRSLGVDGDPKKLFSHLPGRKLFVTKGGLVGSGAATLQAGDDLFVLIGGAMPYILRPKDDYFLMVGEVFVHGLMEGEVIVEWAEERLDPHWVTLR